MSSTRLYTVITRYWPRIAAGLVLALGLLEFVIGGVGADSGLELFIFAWATTTGGLWFLFEKAEKALSDESRTRVVGWLRSSPMESGIESIPEQFSSLFDRVFGSRHLSIRCLLTSGLASIVSVAVVTVVWIGIRFPDETTTLSTVSGVITRTTYRLEGGAFLAEAGVVLVLAMLFNLIPDYVSLLQTRVLMGWARRGRAGVIVLADLALTAVLSAGLMYGGASLFLVAPSSPEEGPQVADLVSLASLNGSVGSLRIPVVPVTRSAHQIDPDSADAQARRLLDHLEGQSEWCRSWSEIRDGGGQCVDPLAGTDFTLQGIASAEMRAADIAWWTEWEANGGAQAEREDRMPAYVDSLRDVYWAAPVEGWYLTTGPSAMGSLGPIVGGSVGLPIGIFFYSAFFTSVWLWLYAASLLASRVLLKMNNGVGFLLRVTDVEKQPFRSMGFVSVVITSVLFAVALPLVLL